MFSVIEAQKIKQAVERILHVPGNFTADILEMAIILDHSVPRERMRENATALARLLKGHSTVFRNARLNIVDWTPEKITQTVVPLSVFMLGGYFDGYERNGQEKQIEPLLEFLRLYQSRSKLVILLTDGSFGAAQEQQASQLMKPFLERKMMALLIDHGESGKGGLSGISLRSVIQV